MKKIAVILLVTFVTAIVASSCNKKECPAYSKGGKAHSKANTEQIGRNV
jgi:hypothetical protein